MKFFLLIVLLAVSSCAAYKTHNQTKKGSVILRGGVYEDESWDKALKLKRVSWYHGVSLYYDLLLWRANLDSPFAKWFSPQEKEFFTKCEDFIVTAAYSADPAKISHINAREQMKLNGYDDVVLNNFSNYLKSHPSANDWRLQNYKVIGFCKRAPSRHGTDDLIINFPSFKQVEIEL